MIYYTLGQRRGLGIGGRSDGTGESFSVIGKDLKRNLLIVQQGEHEELYSTALTADKINWIAGEPPESEFSCTAKFRYRQPDRPVRVRVRGGGAEVEFSAARARGHAGAVGRAVRRRGLHRRRADRPHRSAQSNPRIAPPESVSFYYFHLQRRARRPRPSK